MVTYDQPYGKPAAPEQIVITINLGDGLRSAKEILGAIDDALWVAADQSYALREIPLTHLPGFPQGEIKHPLTGVTVGEWKVTS